MAHDGLFRLEDSAQRANAISRALRQSAAHAESLERATEKLLSENNERAADWDEMRSSVDGVVTSIEQTNATVQKLGRAQQEVSEIAIEAFRGLQASAAGLQELTASIASVSKDTSTL